VVVAAWGSFLFAPHLLFPTASRRRPAGNGSRCLAACFAIFLFSPRCRNDRVSDGGPTVPNPIGCISTMGSRFDLAVGGLLLANVADV